MGLAAIAGIASLKISRSGCNAGNCVWAASTKCGGWYLAGKSPQLAATWCTPGASLTLFCWPGAEFACYF